MALKIKKPIKQEDKINEDNINYSIGAKSALFWGSSDSGKSVLATIIGKKLAEQNKNKNVVIVYADEITPIMNCFFPTNIFNTIESLGTLFTPLKLTEDLIFSNLTSFKKYENLGLLGFKNCENYAQYPECTEDIAKQLISILKKSFDYVIIDGSTTFIYNQLTSISFNEVDICFKVCTQDLKSASYFGSNEAFLETVDIKINKQATILNKLDERGIYEEVFNKINSYDYKIDFSKSLKDIVEKGNLMLHNNDKNFENTIDRIIKEVF